MKKYNKSDVFISGVLKYPIALCFAISFLPDNIKFSVVSLVILFLCICGMLYCLYLYSNYFKINMKTMQVERKRYSKVVDFVDKISHYKGVSLLVKHIPIMGIFSIQKSELILVHENDVNNLLMTYRIFIPITSATVKKFCSELSLPYISTKASEILDINMVNDKCQPPPKCFKVFHDNPKTFVKINMSFQKTGMFLFLTGMLMFLILLSLSLYFKLFWHTENHFSGMILLLIIAMVISLAVALLLFEYLCVWWSSFPDSLKPKIRWINLQAASANLTLPLYTSIG